LVFFVLLMVAATNPLAAQTRPSNTSKSGALSPHRALAETIGPDLVVSSVAYDNVRNWGSESPTGDVCDDPSDLTCTAAFSIGTIACNLGDTAANWIAFNNEHPVIRQGIYRLRDGQFEQIGTSWVLHGFLATNDPGPCEPTCVSPGADSKIHPGCATPEGSSINGARAYLSATSEVNAFTGAFFYPPLLATGSGAIANRIQVGHADLDRAVNTDARYFGEAHYITADDALAGNGENNASYKELDVFVDDDVMGGFTTCISPFCVWDIGATAIGDAAIRAWGEVDPTVQLTDARVPGEGLFTVGAKVSDLGGGFWRYEYAVANLNSDRSGGYFEVPIPSGATVVNVGFHDINYHSGEPWDGTDWAIDLSQNRVRWSTSSYEVDPNANALRWSTLYNFRFDADVPPADESVTLGLFKPGTPDEIAIRTTAPTIVFSDCNNNGIDDAEDVADCVADLNCTDCNRNRIPDVCENDPIGATVNLGFHYASFRWCMDGPSPASLDSCCIGFDVELNETVDLHDFADFQRAFTGG
jgi:hypothetical protein